MNRKIKIILIAILMLSLLLINQVNYKNEDIAEMKLKENAHNNAFSILVSDESGNYNRYENNTLPSKDEYKFNNEMSKCIDNNGNIINNSLAYDDVNNLVTLKTNKTSFCYLYYDINNTITFTIEKTTESGLIEVAYEAEPRMTWADWIESKYNIDGIVKLECANLANSNVKYDRFGIVYDGAIVVRTDLIVENGIYSVNTIGTPEKTTCDL